MRRKPTIFIGSSSEGLRIAEAVFEHLSHDLTPKLWTNQVFQPGSYPMETLEAEVRSTDFAVLVASPDDKITKREQFSPAMRDNVMLEFGMFAGALGRRRAFFICPNETKIELPSDLFGLIIATYDDSRVSGNASNISASVQVPCQQIRSVVEQEWAAELQARQDRQAKVANSERGAAIRRLHFVAVELRDAVAIVQRESLAALSNQTTFEQIKKSAADKISAISRSYSDDANSVQAARELSQLTEMTITAVLDLPFPQELSTGKETKDNVVETGLGALNTFLQGGNPVAHLERKVAGEADRRIEGLKARYGAWWESHARNLEDAATAMTDRLFDALVEIST